MTPATSGPLSQRLRTAAWWAARVTWGLVCAAVVVIVAGLASVFTGTCQK